MDRIQVEHSNICCCKVVGALFVVMLFVCLLLFTEQSLEWESFEQYCVWQLMGAEGPDPSLVIPSLATMSNKGKASPFSRHHEQQR